MNEKILQAWSIVSPAWPLKYFVSSNPLNSYASENFKDALKKYVDDYLIEKHIPEELRLVNKENIKWCQTFFDQGQAKICLKWKESGFYYACRKFFVHDDFIHQKNDENLRFIKNLPENSSDAIKKILKDLNIEEKNEFEFLKIILTTLPGWAAHAKYLFDWSEKKDNFKKLPADYLAVRLLILRCLWPEAKQLVSLNQEKSVLEGLIKKLNLIEVSEKRSHKNFLEKLKRDSNSSLKHKPKLQIVFCIDVRCEKFRRNLEKLGDYQTFGAAGFYNLPIKIKDEINLTEYFSCPVFLKARQTVHLKSENKNFVNIFKQVYQSLKYNFVTPFALVESLGPWAFFILFFKTFLPSVFLKLRSNLVNYFSYQKNIKLDLSEISLEDQAFYAQGFLKSIDLINNFSDFVILSGHESLNENNAFFSSLDCGACGGNSGKINAQVMSKILNTPDVRKILSKKFDLKISENTFFIAAIYNTTTEDFQILNSSFKNEKFFQDLKTAKDLSNQEKGRLMNLKSKDYFNLSGADWSQVRPEFGLIGNSFFIIGPRSQTKNIDLQGQAFLHSYNYENDLDGKILKQILQGPVNVAHQINMQYFFSTLDNNLFGSGNKVTQNYAGRIGVIKGNLSDLEIGLSWQSLFKGSNQEFFMPSRLSLIIFAPEDFVKNILSDVVQVKDLIEKEWIHLTILD